MPTPAGVGIPNFSADMCNSVFVAGAAAYVSVFPQSTGAIRAEAIRLSRVLPGQLSADPACARLVSPGRALAPSPFPVANITPLPTAGLQRHFTRVVASAERRAIAQGLSPVAARAADLLSSPWSRAFLTLLPFDDLIVSPPDFQAYVAHRYRSASIAEFVCGCGVLVSSDSSSHHLRCRCAQGAIITRHNAVRDILGDLLASSGRIVSVEDPMGAPPWRNTDARMDLVVGDIFAAGVHAVDVRVSCSDEALVVAEGHAITEKVARYGARCAELGWELSTFFLTSTGVPGPRTVELLDKLAPGLARVQLQSFQRALSVVMARACGAALRACVPRAVLARRHF